MSKNIKLILTMVILVFLIATAGVAYKILSKDVDSNNNLGITKEESTVGTETAESKKELQKAPDFTVLDKDGNSVSFLDLVGKPIVLNFWASWCSPCKSEMPEFNQVYEDLSEDVTFIMINLTDGQRETVETATAFVEENAYSFPVYFDTTQDAAYTYGIRSIPTTIFIDADGNIVTGVQGTINEKLLLQYIDLIK